MSEDGYQLPNGLPANLVGATTATRYVGGTASVAPTTGTFAVGDYVVTATGAVFVCTVAGTPGTWVDAATIGPSVSSVFSRTGAVVAVDGDYYGVVAAAKTGATAASRYVGATASGAPASGTFAVGDFIIDQTGKVFVCTVLGTPGTWVQAGGNVTSVFSRTGAVVAATNDYSYAQIAASANAIAVSNLAAGTASQVVGGATPAYVTNAGFELDYVQIVASVNTTATSSATGTTIITGTSLTYAAVPIVISFYTPRADIGATTIHTTLWDGATELGELSFQNVASENLFCQRRLTPSAGTHQYIVKAWVNTSGTGTISAGDGTVGNFMPAFVRVQLV